MSTTIDVSKLPGHPTVIKDEEQLEDIYILHYRHGMNPNCQKGFTHNGGLKSAIERAQRHCEIMGYRYIFVRPFICDLSKEEKQKFTREQENND